MKLKLIKDDEVVVSKVEYQLLKQNYAHLKDIIHSIDLGNVNYYVDDSFYPLVKVTNNEVSFPIKKFSSDDIEYNRICAEELVELLNQKQ